MEIYFILTSLVILLLVFPVLDRRLIILPFTVLALFSGLRYYVGIDYIVYSDIFDFAKYGANTTTEPFFIYVVQFCVVLGGTAQLMFFLLAFITNFFVCKFILDCSKNIFISFLLYFSIVSFYLYTFNATRQWAACSIFLFSFYYLVNKRYYIFIFINIAAALFFHFSLLFIIPMVLACTYTFSKKIQLIMLGAAIFTAFSIKILLSNTVYAVYASDNMEFDTSVDMKIYVFLIMNLAIHLFNKSKNKDFYSRVIFNINYISILLLIIIIIQGSGTFVLILKRVHNYFLAFYIIIIPYLICYLSPQARKIVNFLLFIALPLLFLITVYLTGKTLMIIPFTFNFNLFSA
jgi:hypothetical protein